MGPPRGNDRPQDLTVKKKTKSSGQSVQKRSVSISGHRTSVSLEPAFWSGLKEIADHEKIPVAALIGTVDRTRTSNLSSALRVFVLDWVRSRPSKTYKPTFPR